MNLISTSKLKREVNHPLVTGGMPVISPIMRAIHGTVRRRNYFIPWDFCIHTKGNMTPYHKSAGSVKSGFMKKNDKLKFDRSELKQNEQSK
jgi:hypothetical protein